MPIYEYRCEHGHLAELFLSMKDDIPRTTTCPQGHEAKRVYSFNFTPDIPEHYNVTIDRVVKSRRHLAAMQKEFGFSDYERGVRRSRPVPTAEDIAEFNRMADLGERRAKQSGDDQPMSIEVNP